MPAFVIFTFLNGSEAKRTILCDTQRLYETEISVSINKVFLEHILLFVYVLSTGTFKIQWQSSCNRDHMGHSHRFALLLRVQQTAEMRLHNNSTVS